MKKGLFAVYDSSANLYDNPFVAVNKAVAVRSFGQACQDPKTPMNQFPKEFRLALIGIYDDETGVITPNVPEAIASAEDYVETKIQVKEKEEKWEKQ